ncbi:MAG: DCC1-like thiol-disulfide oxidoreductase family protein [Sneathiella sp.]
MKSDLPAYSFRVDDAVPNFIDTAPFTVMDAQCSLCARGAKWIAHNDHQNVFRIIPLQSDLGKALMRHYGMDPTDPMSWLFIENGRGYTSMDAVIRVGDRLGGVWKVLNILRVIPKHGQDYFYGLIARNRYRFFGKTDLCNVSDVEIKKRLIT